MGLEMKIIYAILVLIISVILEFFGITLVDRIDRYINNKILSSLIVISYCIIGFVIIIFISIKFGIFTDG
jgi:hypothetical protein